MKKISVEIEGMSPLMMHSSAGMKLEKGKKALSKETPEEAAEKAAYKSETGELYIPALNIYSMIVKAASGYKIGKKSAVSTVAGTIRVLPDEVLLGTDKYEIDTRSAVNRLAGRVMVYRPKLDKWKCSFDIVYHEEYFPEKIAVDLLKEIVKEAGIRVGLGSYRPEKRGFFGTFKITEWKPVE